MLSLLLLLIDLGFRNGGLRLLCVLLGLDLRLNSLLLLLLLDSVSLLLLCVLLLLRFDTLGLGRGVLLHSLIVLGLLDHLVGLHLRLSSLKLLLLNLGLLILEVSLESGDFALLGRKFLFALSPDLCSVILGLRKLLRLIEISLRLLIVPLCLFCHQFDISLHLLDLLLEFSL